MGPHVIPNSDCPAYIEPKIIYTPLYDEPVLDTSLDTVGIRYMSSKAQFQEAARREIPVGLTSATQQLDTNFEITTQDMPDGLVCAQITNFELRFGFTGTNVYVARELPRTSCGFNEIYQHEQKHVTADHEIITTYIPKLGALMPDFLRNIGVIRVGSVANASQRFNFLINEYMNKLNAQMASVYAEKQGQIDTPAEYRRLSTSCSGELSKMIALPSQH